MTPDRTGPVVAINAQISPTCAGGTETSVLSLIQGLGAEDLGPEYRVLALPQYVEAMRAFLSKSQEVVAWRHPDEGLGSPAPKRHWLTRFLGRQASANDRTSVDRDLQGLGVELIHFPHPLRFPTELPYVYEPQDLQHCHLPEFFTPEQIEFRDRVYGGGSRSARFVVVGTHWTKWDVVERFQVPPERVAVVPRGSLMPRRLVPRPEARATLAKLGLPERFAYYPAMCFPHKNHLRLMQAVARLRDQGKAKVHIVCSGRLHKPYWPTLEAELERLRLGDQFRFLGAQPEEVLCALFSCAQYMIFPSLFEGLSQSLLEGLQCGLPILAADASSNGETVGRAGLLFDGTDVGAIAAALAEADDHPERLERLRAAAPAEAARYAWPKAARTLAALYRQVAGHSLGAREQALVTEATASPRPALAKRRAS